MVSLGGGRDNDGVYHISGDIVGYSAFPMPKNRGGFVDVRPLIEQGFHREAVFWIAATYSRCQCVLAQDAPKELEERHRSGYQELLADLGIVSFVDLQRRAEAVRASLPHVWAVAETIMTVNLAILDETPSVSP